MYTVTYTNTDGNVMKLLLNASDPRSDKLREIVGDGDPCSVNNLLGDANARAGRRPING